MENTEVLKQLVIKHYELMAIYYDVKWSNETHWRFMAYHTGNLHQLIVQAIGEANLLPIHYVETTQQLIIRHWQLWQMRDAAAEPPAYLVNAIDYIERNYPTWFSYQKSQWMEA